MKATIWHNPRCSKSRAALAILNAEPALELTIVDYLKTPPSRDELAEMLLRGGMAPRNVLRRNEDSARQLVDASDPAIIEAMLANPILIERPIVSTAKGVVVARPPERVREIL